MWTNLGITTDETLLGFGFGSLLGITLGVLIAEFPVINEALYPLIIAFQAMPKVAIAPLLLLWFGFGVASKVAIAALLAFFPLLVNTALGLHASDPQQEELMHSLAAQRWQIFVMVRLRNALPSIFAGLELAMVFSVIGAIVGEFVGARGGLGYMIQQRNANVDVAGILSVLLILGIVGAVLTYCVKIVDHYVVFWNHRK
jgi:NitT/TauT family transport system permease protein